ncbi:MAG: DinB family protein [Pseudomonadota bacterium]
MFSATYFGTMARYNRWQNRSIFGAADGIGEAARREDRGAFFRSIHETLSHLMWGDTVWMARLDGWDMPEVGLSDSPHWVKDWDDMKARRPELDAKLLAWSLSLEEADTEGEFAWWSDAAGREMRLPKATCMMQIFNHQTHHRGQVHAMLTAAGARPEATDLPFMPAKEFEEGET